MPKEYAYHAEYMAEVDVEDKNGLTQTIAVYMDTSAGAPFALDASWIEQEEPKSIESPYNKGVILDFQGD